MSSSPRTDTRSDGSQVRRTRLAAAWAEALHSTGFVPMSAAEARDFLDRQAGRLLGALRTEPFHPGAAAAVGAALVQAHFVGADVLGRSLTTVGTHLSAHPAGRPNGVPAGRVTAVQEALASGYVHALRERVLAEQEEIRRADIDARRRAEEARRASDARFQAVFAEAGIGIGLNDTSGRIVQVNNAFAGMLGYTVEEFSALNVQDFTLPDDAPGMWDLYADMVAGRVDHVRMEKGYRHRDGHVVWTNLTVSLIRDVHGAPLYNVAMVEDISERRALQERLQEQALHDPLTRLPNRRLFFERLAGAFTDAGARVGVCYLDLDGFKAINDTLGHDIGDELLVAVARRLDSATTGPGRLLARMGGDEFVILVERTTDAGQVAEIASAALAALDSPFVIGGRQLRVSASAGVVEREVRGTSPADVMKAADITLYWAKGDGRGRWRVFDADRNARQVTRHTLATMMPAAIEAGEFALEYQPLVDLADGTVRGMEALVRWDHPRFGRLLPDEFVPLAEETGAIVPLGRWVLGEACRQARRWQTLFPELGVVVSVNVAVRQASEPSLVPDVDAALAGSGLAPGLLQLELTESTVLGTAGRPRETLQQLADRGVRLAIDDFGTGYSNLAYLRWLPVHALKLAGSFVSEANVSGTPASAGSERSTAVSSQREDPIVASVVALAHTLGLTVCAEGVETAAQAERLRALRCDTAQGWYFARPAGAVQATALLRRAARRRAAPPSTTGERRG